MASNGKQTCLGEMEAERLLFMFFMVSSRGPGGRRAPIRYCSPLAVMLADRFPNLVVVASGMALPQLFFQKKNGTQKQRKKREREKRDTVFEGMTESVEREREILI